MSIKVEDEVVIAKCSSYYSKSKGDSGQSHNEAGDQRVFIITALYGSRECHAHCHRDDYGNVYKLEDLELYVDPEEPKVKGKPVRPKKVKVLESMELMVQTLEKVYDNKELRKSCVPLFIGNPGLGKTKMIEAFAKKKGAKLVELITSQMSPFEISGIAMPDKETKKMTYYNFDKIETLKSGDILFFDELLNGNPVVLNACLTILEQRMLISGKKLPNIMIIAAANPQGMVPLTPQIKERFIWYNVKFSPNMWKTYMKDNYSMPSTISSKLCKLIEEEDFGNNNFYTPRSVDKAVRQIANECPTPYADILNPILSGMISNKFKKRKIPINKEEFLNPGESMIYLDFLKKTRV